MLVLVATCVVVLACLPLAAVTFPPATDLPQHLAQMQLLAEAIRHPHGPYVVQWWAPNGLAYLFVALSSLVAAPLVAGRLTLALLVAAWITATAWLAHERGRRPSAFVLASVFVFAHPLYWGFIEFLVGWPLCAVYMGLLSRPTLSRRRWMLLWLVAAALYGAHVLWLGATLVGVVVFSVAERTTARTCLRRIAPLSVPFVAAAFWSWRLGAERSAGGFEVGARWSTLPWQRVLPDAWVSSALGGLQGPLESVVVGLATLYVIAGAIATRDSERKLDRGLAALAGLLLATALLAPNKYLNTLGFASRWLGPAYVLAILAVPPPPRIRPALMLLLSFATLTLFVTATTASWMAFENEELLGLETALAQVPDGSRVVGLDFVRKSDIIAGDPFLQLFAYAQALHGGTLNFSFAEHGSSLVRYRAPRSEGFTPIMEWFPDRFQPSDAQYFDVALVNAPPSLHIRLAQTGEFEPTSASGTWRLYRLHAKPVAHRQ